MPLGEVRSGSKIKRTLDFLSGFAGSGLGEGLRPRGMGKN